MGATHRTRAFEVPGAVIASAWSRFRNPSVVPRTASSVF